MLHGYRHFHKPIEYKLICNSTECSPGIVVLCWRDQNKYIQLFQ